MRAAAAALLLAASLLAGRAQAHAMPNSTVELTATANGLEAVVMVPLSELEAALGRPVARDASSRKALEPYLRAHIAVTGADGRRWPMGIMQQWTEGGEHPALGLVLRFPRPAGSAARGAQLRYDAVNHAIASHYALVYRRDGPDLIPLGRLQAPDTTLRLP